MEAKDFEPRCIETIQSSDGEVYAVKVWPSWGRWAVLGIICFMFLGASFFLIHKVFGPLVFPKIAGAPVKINNLFALLCFALFFLAGGSLVLYMFSDSISRKETWFSSGFLHLRRRLFGIVWKKAIPINKIRDFEIAWAGNGMRKNYWAVNVNHYAGGRKIMMKRGGYWKLNLASALVDESEAEYFAELLTENAGLKDMPVEAPPEIQELADANLRFREKLLKSAYIVFGIWGLAGLFACIALQYILIHSPQVLPEDGIVPPVFLMMFIPFGFTASRMTIIGVNASEYSSKKVQLKVRKRFYGVLRYFPFSTGIFILILLIYFFYAIINVNKNEELFFLFISAVFYSFTAFMNLRVFLSGRELIEKWRREDEGQPS